MLIQFQTTENEATSCFQLETSLECIADSTMEAEYVSASEAAKEAIWFQNFLLDLDVVPNLPQQITIYCDNTGAVAVSYTHLTLPTIYSV